MKIRDIIGTLDYDTNIRITNRKEGLVFRGDADDMPMDYLDYRIVTIKIHEYDAQSAPAEFEIWAVK